MYEERRKFLNLAAGVIISTGLSLFADVKERGRGNFFHGVASGDPLQDRVIIWTRVTPLDNQNLITIVYEVSLEKDFKHCIHSGNVIASQAHDYTVKIDLLGLEPNTHYYYRFKSANALSQVGRTLTLPEETDAITLALFSCANFTSGYFNAYRDACQFQQIDAVVHLGDYIYEYGMLNKSGEQAYGTVNAKKIGREFPKDNDKELISLNDYRKRYALYRQDSDLQEVHRLFPFICVWDDHEVCNNAYSFTDVEGIKRKKAAIQAYYEWLPIRPPEGEKSEKIFRAFHFGKLFSLYMLDTRLFSREKQLEYRHYLSANGELDLKKIHTDLTKNSRKLIGNEQLDWLENELQTSTASWQIIAQQVKMSETLVPLEIIELATLYDVSTNTQKKELLKEKLIQAFNETSRIKARIVLNDKTVSAQERVRVEVMLPYNLDVWDGYPKERERLFEILKRFAKKSVVLSGDAHYSWSNKLVDKASNVVAIEIGVTSVTSPGIEADYNLEDTSLLKTLENTTALFDSHSLYCNYLNRGYVVLEIEKETIKSHWRYVDTVEKKEYSTILGRNKTMKFGLVNSHYHTQIH